MKTEIAKRRRWRLVPSSALIRGRQPRFPKVLEWDSQCQRLLWILCFAVVVLAHGAGALTFWHRSAEPEFGVDAPVVALELPASFLIATVPPTNLAPDAREDESEATLVPKEETAPRSEAEAVIPQPPSPEPSQGPREAAAPPAAATAIAVMRRWESELVAHIERFKRYPATARGRGNQGRVRLAFTVDRDGWVRGSRVVQSSGWSELDQEALGMLIRAQPVPRPPAASARADFRQPLSFTVPVRFSIR